MDLSWFTSKSNTSCWEIPHLVPWFSHENPCISRIFDCHVSLPKGRNRLFQRLNRFQTQILVMPGLKSIDQPLRGSFYGGNGHQTVSNISNYLGPENENQLTTSWPPVHYFKSNPPQKKKHILGLLFAFIVPHEDMPSKHPVIGAIIGTFCAFCADEW